MLYDEELIPAEEGDLFIEEIQEVSETEDYLSIEDVMPAPEVLEGENDTLLQEEMTIDDNLLFEDTELEISNQSISDIQVQDETVEDERKNEQAGADQEQEQRLEQENQSENIQACMEVLIANQKVQSDNINMMMSVQIFLTGAILGSIVMICYLVKLG